MQSVATTERTFVKGALEEFISPDDIKPLHPLAELDWDRVRKTTGRRLFWQFCSFRNLILRRGAIVPDAVGFAWGAIYRDMLVSRIVTSSYRNGGHYRIADRGSGTGDFFAGSFALPRSKGAFPEILRLVNLRHHVAGIIDTPSEDCVAVRPCYEADYTYVASAFIESIRRGLECCGLPRNSRKGRALASELCTVLYQLAAYTGLTRAPLNLDAHDRFCKVFDERIKDKPPSRRVRLIAQRYAFGMIPFTAARARETVGDHIRRHLDKETAEYLFPDGQYPSELEIEREKYLQTFSKQKTLSMIIARSKQRELAWSRPDIAALYEAYLASMGRPGPADDRLIGSVLLYALSRASVCEVRLERRSIKLSAGECVIRQGETQSEMWVVLTASAPLIVSRPADGDQGGMSQMTITAPHVIGIMSMWRGQPEASTISTQVENKLDIIVIDDKQYTLLAQESGFQAAIGDEVRRRLSVNAASVGSLLNQAVASSNDPLLASIDQLFRFLCGDSESPLDKIIDFDIDASMSEFVEAFRDQVNRAILEDNLPDELKESLTKAMWYI